MKEFFIHTMRKIRTYLKIRKTFNNCKERDVALAEESDIQALVRFLDS